MLERVIKAINGYQECYDEENTKLKKEMARIEKEYNPMGEQYHDAKAVARNQFNEKVAAKRLEAIEDIRTGANEARNSLADIISKAASQDALTTIELLKAGNPEKTSEFEVLSILDKYKDNYLATKMIVQITNASKRFGIKCAAADSIIDDIDKVEKMACETVNQYNGVSTYQLALLLKGELIRGVNEEVNNFLNHKYYDKLSELMRRSMNA